MFELKKILSPKPRIDGGYDIIFWDMKKNKNTEDQYTMPKGTLGFIVDAGKINNKRCLTFWFLEPDMENKCIIFVGIKHFNKYCKKILSTKLN